MAKIIGIDLGTTNSVISVMEGGEAVIIPNAEGQRTTPSVVAFTKEGERLVGQVAKNQAQRNPDRTLTSIKREMGTNNKHIIDGKEYTPTEISAMILQKLKADAEAYLGDTVTQAVVTVPAYFSDSQRQATNDAGRIAGLQVDRIINEPTAASLAYGLEKGDNQTILIYDLGGGTFDVSILELGDGVFDVKATSGNTKLGGDDFDNRIVDWMIQEMKNTEGIDLSKDKFAVQRLRDAAEKAKIELSSVLSSNISLPYISSGEDGPKHLDLDLSRAKFEDMTRDLVEATIDPVRSAMKDAGLQPDQIDKILLVGGSTRTPAVQEAVKKFFNKEPYKGINPDECVALGAAIQGGILSGDVDEMVLLDVTPLSLGLETLGGVMTRMIERNTTIPTSKKQVFSTAADNQTQVEVHILQGERPMAADNRTLGRFFLDGIPPSRAGIPQIEVSFDIDANGIVNVTAVDLTTKRKQNITITASSNMSDADIERAVKEAEEFAEADKERAEKAHVRNEAETKIRTTERLLEDEETGKLYQGEDREAVMAAVEKLKQSHSSDDIEAMKTDSAALDEVLYKIAEKLSQQAQQAQQGQPEQPDGPAPGNEPGTYEADFKDVGSDED